MITNVEGAFKRLHALLPGNQDVAGLHEFCTARLGELADICVDNAVDPLHPISDSNHCHERTLAIFVFSRTAIPYQGYDPNHPATLPFVFQTHRAVDRFYVLAEKCYSFERENRWEARSHSLGNDRDINFMATLNIDAALGFMLVRSHADQLTREGLIAKVREAKTCIRKLEQKLSAKNIELDALHHVWCTGSCGGGQHRYHRDIVLDEATLRAAVTAVNAMVVRGSQETRDLWRQCKKRTLWTLIWYHLRAIGLAVRAEYRNRGKR